MSESKRCKICKKPYSSHVDDILENWDHTDPNHYTKANKILNDAPECNRFKMMNNLELLEWEYEQRINETPTANSLK